MSEIFIKKTESYEINGLVDTIRQGFDALGGIEEFISEGDVVLLKPNCLLGVMPDTGIITHPEFIRAVIRVIKPAAGRILIGDSPGFGSYRSAAAKNGTKKAADEEGAEIVEFKADTTIKPARRMMYAEYPAASEFVKADKIINLPKIKTHTLMYMTMCIKNMYGIIPGIRKIEYHAKAERSRYDFAKMLVEIYGLKKPVINIVDGILGLHGNGPGSDGRPIKTNMVIMGRDGFDIDRFIPPLVGLDPEKVYTNEVYIKEVLKEKKSDIIITGDDPQYLKVKFDPPPAERAFSAFGGMINFFRGHGTAKPVFVENKCTGCGTCVSHCPVNALQHIVKEKKGRKVHKIKCDYNKCIRCFCCHEMCRERAIAVKKPLLSHIFK
ncbi:MAG: DUF362 domain-containing protein [Candidatus Goldiibacteriota bacterium]